MPSPSHVPPIPIDANLLAAALARALGEMGLARKEAQPSPAPPPTPMEQIAAAPILRCSMCHFEASREEARNWRWQRSPSGWTCHLHPPLSVIDFPLCFDVVRMLAEEADALGEKVCTGSKDAAGILESVGHLEHLLAEVRRVVEPLRDVAAGEP